VVLYKGAKNESSKMSQPSPKVSIIIAVFNAESTLYRSLESVRQQSFDDYEVVIVDDGSQDSSWDILSQYKDKDKRFKVFKQENKGVSKTRQFALDNSSGEYTIHLDADDWMEPDLLSKMVARADETGADMVLCGFILHTEYGQENDLQRPSSLESDKLLGELLSGTLHGSLCNKLIRRSVYVTNKIGYPVGIDCGEDLLACLSMLSKNIKVEYEPSALYHYDKTRNDSSVTNKWYDYPVKKRVELIQMIEPIVSFANKRIFNTYVGRIAYDALFCSRAYCPNYRSLFGHYSANIRNSDLPFLKYVFIFLRLHNVRLPLRQFRRFIRSH